MKINLGENEGLATPGNFILELIVGGVFTGIVVFGLIFYTNQLEQQKRALNQDISGLETNIKQDADLREKRKIYRAQKEELESKNQAISFLEAKQIGPVFVFSELSDLISNRVYFRDLVLEKGEIRISGRALDNLILADFLTRLNDSEYFSSVALESVNHAVEEAIDLMEFKIIAKLRTPRYE